MNTNPEHERDALIDRYVNGKLTAGEEAEFEIQMMDDAELFEEVKLVEALKTGLSEHSDLLLQEPEPRNAGEVLPFSSWLRQPFSLAASLLVAAFGLLTLYDNTGTSRDTNGNDALAIGTVILVEPSRGDTSLHFSGPPPYLLQVDAGLGNQSTNFSLSLVGTSSEESIRLPQDLRTGQDGWLRLVLNAPLNGDYHLQVQWNDEAGLPQSRDYNIRVSP